MALVLVARLVLKHAATNTTLPGHDHGRGRWLLIRRSITEPNELAFYLCAGPADTTIDVMLAHAFLAITTANDEKGATPPNSTASSASPSARFDVCWHT